jgi:succinoglycan biosynthesis transport protein ExoP
VNASIVLPDPQLAAQIVNILMKRYIELQGNSRVQYNLAANADITKHLNEVRQQVDQLDAKARDLRAKNELVTIMPAGSLGQQKLSELGTEQARATADLQQLQAKLALATQLTKEGNTAELADVLSSQTISRLREQEAIAAEHLAKLDATVTPKSRIRQSVQAEYAQAQRQIKAEAGRIAKSLIEQVAAAQDQVTSATAALGAASASAASASLIQANIVQIQKEADSRRRIYLALLERASQTAVSPEVARESPGVYIGAPALVPVFPSGPRTKLVAVLGMLGSLMIGCVFAVKRGNDISLAATPEEIAIYMHLPLLGMIPASRRSQNRLTGAMRPKSSADRDKALALLYARVRHQGYHRGRELRSILFIGADGDDISLLAQHFSSLAGQESERVLLIDTYLDAHKPKERGQGKTNAGLQSVLDGECSWRDTLIPYPDAMTNLLPASGRSLEVIDNKAATRLRSMLQEAADDYTLVIISSRWDVRSTQASHLVQAADLTILSVDAQKLRPSAVKAAVDHLTSIKNSVGLAVMTRAA